MWEIQMYPYTRGSFWCLCKLFLEIICSLNDKKLWGRSHWVTSITPPTFGQPNLVQHVVCDCGRKPKYLLKTHPLFLL